MLMEKVKTVTKLTVFISTNSSCTIIQTHRCHIIISFSVCNALGQRCTTFLGQGPSVLFLLLPELFRIVISCKFLAVHLSLNSFVKSLSSRRSFLYFLK